jgi:hypothetical protein
MMGAAPRNFGYGVIAMELFRYFLVLVFTGLAANTAARPVIIISEAIREVRKWRNCTLRISDMDV